MARHPPGLSGPPKISTAESLGGRDAVTGLMGQIMGTSYGDIWRIGTDYITMFSGFKKKVDLPLFLYVSIDLVSISF